MIENVVIYIITKSKFERAVSEILKYIKRNTKDNNH